MPAHLYGHNIVLLLIVWLVASLSTLVVILKFVFSGMVRTYPLLPLYLVATLTEHYVLYFRPGHFYYFEASHIVEYAVSALILRNLCSRAFEDYPALARYMRNGMMYLVGVFGLIAVLVFLANPSLPEGRSPLLQNVIGLEQSASSVLFVFVLLFSVALVWFPIRVKRNVACVFAGFGFIYGMQWITSFVVNSYPEKTDSMNLVGFAVLLCVLVVWWGAIDQEGEEAVTITGHRWNPAAYGHLTLQLSSMNTRLGEVRKQSAV